MPRECMKPASSAHAKQHHLSVSGQSLETSAEVHSPNTERAEHPVGGAQPAQGEATANRSLSPEKGAPLPSPLEASSHPPTTAFSLSDAWQLSIAKRAEAAAREGDARSPLPPPADIHLWVQTAEQTILQHTGENSPGSTPSTLPDHPDKIADQIQEAFSQHLEGRGHNGEAPARSPRPIPPESSHQGGDSGSPAPEKGLTISHQEHDGSQQQKSMQEMKNLLGSEDEGRATTLLALAQEHGFETSDVVNWLKSGLSSEQAEHILRNPTLPYTPLYGTRSELFETLSQSHPSLDQSFLSYLLSIRPQGIYLTQTQIEETLAIIQRINRFQTPGWEENNLSREIAALHRANIPGTEKLAYDLFNGNYTGTDYLGSRFQLTWANAHLGQITAIEDFRPNGTKGIDVRLKDGTFVDTKSVRQLSLSSLRSQVDAYARDFPDLQGHTLSFVLESRVTLSTPESIARLEERIRAYTQQKNYPFTVHVSSYP